MIAALAVVAWGGVVVDEEVGFDSVTDVADAAVIVTLGDPAMRHANIPVPGSEKKDCGPYQYGVWRVTVDEVVRAPARGPALTVGQPINVFPANTDDLVDLTRMGCLEGVSASPIFERFMGESPDAGEHLLVLLRWVPPYGWIEAVSGAWVLPSAADTVRAAQRPRADTAAPTGQPHPEDLLCVEASDCKAAKVTCATCSCPGDPPDVFHIDALKTYTEACRAWVAVAPIAECPACPMPKPHPVPPVTCRDMRCRFDL